LWTCYWNKWFTFGVSSGAHISYSGSTLTLTDTSIDVTGGYVWAGTGTPGVGTGVGLISTGFYGFNGTTQTIFISATDGSFELGSSTDHQLKFISSTGALTLDGTKIGVADDTYVWVGNTDLSNGCGLTGGISGFPDGFYATHSGLITAFISAVYFWSKLWCAY